MMMAMVSSPGKMATSGSTLGECVFRKLPNFYSTAIKLSTLLDVANPLGNDYRAVLELLGFKREEVQFWGDRCMRPTLEALRAWDGTVQELASALWECQRTDALSELVSSLVEVLRESHKTSATSETNPLLAQDAFSAIASTTFASQPMPVKVEDIGTCTETSRLSDYTDDAIAASTQNNKHCLLSPAPGKGFSLAACDDAMAMFGEQRALELERLLKQHFAIPAQIALSCLAPSRGRGTTEFVCRLVTAAAAYFRCMSNAGDLTWISNTTVYINNFARVFLLLMASMNVAACLFGPHHTPTHVLELILAAVPVAQSLYVEQNLPLYRDFVRKIKELEAGMLLIAKTLEQRGISDTKSAGLESSRLKELETRRARLDRLKQDVLPVYGDIRLCIVSTLLIEFLLVLLVLGMALLSFSGEEILAKTQDGFTSLALVLICVDCAYNFAIVAVYYHDPTIETVLQKDRFRLNASLFLKDSDNV